MSKELWRKILRLLRPLLNEKGEIGVDIQKVPGSDEGAAPGAGAVNDNITNNGEQAPIETPPPAGAIKTEEGVQAGATPAQPIPGQATGAEAGAAPQPPASPAADVESLRAEITRANEIANFYQNLFNEKYNGEITARTMQPGAPQPPAQPEKEEEFVLPEGVLPPEKWQSQSDYSKYIDARSQFLGKQAAKAIVKEQNARMAPVFQRVQQVLGAIEDMVVRSKHEDFEQVTEPVLKEIFTFDPAGNLLAIKNPALLQYFQKSSMPKMAMYQYGLSKRAPQKIKEAVTKATTDLVNNIQNKPKVTMPKSPGSGDQTLASKLDWDTPKEKVDELLSKQGL